jgi:hypothetical protein
VDPVLLLFVLFTFDIGKTCVIEWFGQVFRAALNKPLFIFTSKTWLICMGIMHLIAGLPCLLTFYISNSLFNGGSRYNELYIDSLYQDVSPLIYKLNCGVLNLSDSGSQVFLVLVLVEILGFFIVAVMLQLCIMYLLSKIVKSPPQTLRKSQNNLMRLLLIQVRPNTNSFKY